jgi:glycosyltransferase involved in cell wall biosynthesis
MTPREAAVTRALFVNSGILGQRTFASFVRTAFAGVRDGIAATQVLVTDDLTLPERVMRAALCARLWPAGAAGLRNLDLQRFRAELNAGLLARNRIRRLERAGTSFDVLHFHRQATAYASLRRMRRVPSIVSCDTTQGWLREMARTSVEAASYLPNVRRDGAIFAAAKLIVSTSHWAARHIRAEYPECATEIAVMPNPVPLPPGSERWIDERYDRAARTPGYRPRVLFVGSDFPRKGGFDLLRAWEARRLHERATLALMTGWPLDASRLPPGVVVHRGVSAYTDAWCALWHEADLFVMPTSDEAWGNVFQEAAAAGLPAIGTRITAVPEIIEDGVTGVLVPPHDADALARALDTLLESPERRRDMGARGRAFVARTADPEHYRAALAAAIRRLAGN